MIFWADHPAIQSELSAWRTAGRRIVLTNGCFDLLHAGHLAGLNEAKRYGDRLVVGINSDSSVRALKGDSRPINPEAERLELVAALKPVDLAVIFDEADASRLIELIRPAVYVKGGDYSLETLPEREALTRLGVEVRFVPLAPGLSTTTTLAKIKAAGAATGGKNAGSK
jgi:rfaE bifunctional protein nucleotidyltransferase chain/domain